MKIHPCAKTAFFHWLSTESKRISSFHNFFKLVYRKGMVIIASVSGIIFLLFTCVTFWVRELYDGGPRVRLPPVKWSTIAESLRNTDVRHAGAKRERRYSTYSFLTSELDGVRGQRHGRSLPLGKGRRYPLFRRLGGPQSWSRPPALLISNSAFCIYVSRMVVPVNSDITLNGINHLRFVMMKFCVVFEVRTEFLNII
jgi:hypothetical protein